MTEFEMHQLLAENRELISDTWYFFLTVHLAIFGIVHIANRRVAIHERLLLATAYFGFITVNYFAQADNYEIYLNLTEKIRDLQQGEPGLLAVKGDQLWITQDQNLFYIYAAAAALSFLIIMFTVLGRRDE